jgi:uncharacterized protein (TIGR02231 family)
MAQFRALLALLLVTGFASAQEAAPSRITEVVCYERTALVTRAVEVPAGERAEVVVGPLPERLMRESLYAEAEAAGVRVLSTRYRQRVERDAADERVRELSARVEELDGSIARLQAALQAAQEDLRFVQELQRFTQATVREAAADADLQAGGLIEFATFITDRRRELLVQQVELNRAVQAAQQERQFVQRDLAQATAAGGGRIIREAVIVVDNPRGEATTARLSYLVTGAGWRPQYRLHADADLETAELEYLASVFQSTGEDWQGVSLTLSTAAPNLNAAPPALDPVSVSLVSGDEAARERLELDEAVRRRQMAQTAYQQDRLDTRSLGSAGEMRMATLNSVAARVLEAEVLGDFDDSVGPVLVEGQSVTFKLAGEVTIPWRDDEQLIEISRRTFEPEVYWKAVPVLTPNVYRVAELTNGGDGAAVLLPGECGVYLGGDFVGRTQVPLVAIGRPFTVGLGIDPQLSVSRQLASRDTDVRGGNQVRRVEYLLRIENFKNEPVPVRLWDRMPTPPTTDEAAVSVEIASTSVPLSEEANYERDERPQGLLRWDLTAEPGVPTEVRFAYTLAFDRALRIGGFETR